MRSSLVCAALGLALVCGCSKRPTAPPLAGPTRYIVFTSDRNRAAGSDRIYVATLDGAIAQVTPRPGAKLIDRRPTLTQDARVIAYESQDSVGANWNVFLYNRSSNAVTNDPSINTAADETDPCISLDGTRLAFVRDSLGTRHVRLYDLVNHRFIPLPGLEAPGFSDWQPTLDAAGHRIAFTTNRNGSTDVMVYQVSLAALSSPADLASPVGDESPALSGDSHYLAFQSNRAGGAGGWDLYVYDVDNGFLVGLPGGANSAEDDIDPTISFDGSNLYFATNRVGPSGGGFDLWTLDRIGAVLKEATALSSTSDDLEPALVWPLNQ